MHIRYSVFNDSSNGGDGFGNLFGMNAMKTMNVMNTMKVNEPHEFGINVTESVSSV